MASEVLEFLNIADNDDTAASADDDLIVLYSTPASFKKGTSKMNPISVEDYPLRAKRVIDLSQDFTYYDIGSDDDEVKVINSFPKIRRKIYKGESSNQKPAKDVESGLPMTFVCEICVDEKPTNELFRVLGCTHSYCSECLAKYVASKLKQNNTIVTCPVLGCKGVLEPYHCRSILPKQVFDMWGDALCEAVVLASEKFYCPFKDCSAMLIDDMRGGNEVITQSECPNCNRLFCAQCKVPWHLGIQCAEFQKLEKDERNNEDIMLMNLAKSKKWMRCPKCSFYVEKSEGCLFITCRCKYTFCYNCGAHLKSHYCSKSTCYKALKLALSNNALVRERVKMQGSYFKATSGIFPYPNGSCKKIKFHIELQIYTIEMGWLLLDLAPRTACVSSLAYSSSGKCPFFGKLLAPDREGAELFDFRGLKKVASAEIRDNGALFAFHT